MFPMGKWSGSEHESRLVGEIEVPCESSSESEQVFSDWLVTVQLLQ